MGCEWQKKSVFEAERYVNRIEGESATLRGPSKSLWTLASTVAL